MSAISLQGNAGGTGTLTVAAPSTNTNRTLTLPDGTGTFSVAGVNSNIVSGTVVASTSGTSIDFTGIPTWVKRITVMLNGVSTSGTSNIQFRLGGASIESTGYLGSGGVVGLASASCANFTAGFGLNSATAAYDFNGNLIITLQDSTSNTWTASGSFGSSTIAGIWVTSGKKSITGVLTQVRITTVNGTDTFDAGSINILYE